MSVSHCKPCEALSTKRRHLFVEENHSGPGAVRGKQTDLNALKQEIQDDASLLSQWRKAHLGVIK